MRYKVYGGVLVVIGVVILLRTCTDQTELVATLDALDTNATAPDNRITLNTDGNFKLHIGDTAQVATNNAKLTWKDKDDIIIEKPLVKGEKLQILGGYRDIVRVYVPAYKQEGVMSVADIALSGAFNGKQ